MTTVKELKEMLSQFDDNMLVDIHVFIEEYKHGSTVWTYAKRYNGYDSDLEVYQDCDIVMISNENGRSYFYDD